MMSPKRIGVFLTVVMIAVVSPADAKRSKGSPAKQTEAATHEPSKASGLAAAFEKLARDSLVSRSVALSDVGLNAAVVMGGTQTVQDIYWPVPANVPLLNAAIQFDAGYMRADPGRTTLVLSLDKTPVIAQDVALKRGDASLLLPLSGVTQASGLVRLGIAWNTIASTNAADSRCTDTRSMGNLLRIEPTSHLSYEFDSEGIRDLSAAWTAMPQAPVILVSGEPLDQNSYETAWRIGLTMERAGKRPSVVTLPSVGQEVDLGAISVPDALRRISSFASLAQGGKHALKNSAELGAWLALNQTSTSHADVIVADHRLASNLTDGLTALSLQIEKEAPDAVAAFSLWRVQRLDSLVKLTVPGELRIANSPGGSTLVVSPDMGSKLAAIFDTPWRDIAASSRLIVKSVKSPSEDFDEDMVSLKALGAEPGSFDMAADGVWDSRFEIGSESLKGRLPTKLALDFSAAPATGWTAPVASVFLNDILLASKRMEADGKTERLIAGIPGYALAPSNVIRVSFVRQLVSDSCREAPVAYPVSVSPSSHLVLGSGNASEDFPGMASRFSRGGDVIIPSTYLKDAKRSLKRLIRISAATGVSPIRSRLVTVAETKTSNPTAPFLALDVSFSTTIPTSLADKGHLVIANAKDRKLLDLTGLTSVGIASVERVDGTIGIVYRTQVDDQERFDVPFRLMRGNFAMIRTGGQLSQFDSRGNLDDVVLDQPNDSVFARNFWWGISAFLIFFFLALLYAANIYRNRKR